MFERVGFWTDEVKPFGPVHVYVAPATAAVERFRVLPVHTGLLLEGVGVDGVALTTTFVVPAAEVQPLTVIVTLYVPASAVAAFERVGFWSADVNPLGPVHAYVALATVGVLSWIVAPAQ